MLLRSTSAKLLGPLLSRPEARESYTARVFRKRLVQSQSLSRLLNHLALVLNRGSVISAFPHVAKPRAS